MDLKKFKLELINKIMQTNDLALLQTIQQVLSLNSDNPMDSNVLPVHPLHQATPGIRMEKLDEAAQELQDSIDQVFNP